MNKLTDLIDSTAAKTGFSGVVSITQDGHDVYNKAFGYRDIKNELTNNKDTIFGIASGTKLFTALGIGVLIDEKKILPDTCVGDINRKFTGFIDEKATIYNLLTHTSGIYDYYDEEIVTDFDNFFVDIPWYQLETPRDYFPLFENKTKKFSPGERYSYSNGGYILLGIIIETVTNGVYREFIKEKILDPAGMKRSGFFSFDNLPKNTANGYLSDGQTTNMYNLPKRGASDGGMFTTASDMTRFWKSLFAFEIISEPLLNSLCTRHIKFNDTAGYGLGLYIDRIKGLDVFYIAGSDAGVGFDSRFIPKNNLIISIFSNITDGEETMKRTIYDNFDAIL